jgi:hypothetical protein
VSYFQEWAKSFDQIVWSKNDLNYCKLAWDKATNISESESQARIADLESQLANAEHKKCEIERTCSECNKAFILKDVHHNPNLQETTSIFDNCPHCHARNDIWVKINWLSK